MKPARLPAMQLRTQIKGGEAMATESYGLIADTAAFRKLAANWRAAAPAAEKAAQKVLRAVALEVAAETKERASFSKHIPATVKVRMAGLNARVSAGGPSAWWAVPIENAGRGAVLHPTFGGPPVTNKNSHPAFLLPSFEAHVVQYIEALKVALTEAADEALKEL